MNLFINGKFLDGKKTGVYRFSWETIKAIDALLEKKQYANQYNIFLICSHEATLPATLTNIHLKRIAFKGNFAEQCLYPVYTKNNVSLNLGNTAPIFKIKKAVVIHDTHIKDMPQMYTKKFVHLWTKAYQIFSKRKTLIFVPSRYTGTRINQEYKIQKDRIVVLGEGYEHILRYHPDYSILRKNNLMQENYLLVVGGTINKNFELIINLLRKYEGLIPKVVIAGDVDIKAFPEIDNFDIELLGRVTDEELVALYKGAFAFIFPSIIEGFGIPPLEAMALSCPVICSNATSLPEVCQDAALYCNPYDVDSLYQSIVLLKDETTRRNMIKKGTQRIRCFSWEKTAVNLLDNLGKV